uniref:Uncharacterized protein n=1 Tax=Anguilla anguilla TaxID=7936 RepID=A0A0E9RR33_ANGAN
MRYSCTICPMKTSQFPNSTVNMTNTVSVG